MTVLPHDFGDIWCLSTSVTVYLSRATCGTMAGCPACGVVAVGHGRRRIRLRLHDIPCMGQPVRLIWAKRLWRCPDENCPTRVFSEQHALAGKRAILTHRAISWSTDALQKYDTSVSALAHQLGVSWRALWKGIEAEARRRINRPARLRGVDALGVDEHLWTHTGFPGTGIIDHTRDAHGTVHAKLLDLVPGRSGKAYADWLKEQGPGFASGIKVAILDPFRGYANAIRDELPEAITEVCQGCETLIMRLGVSLGMTRCETDSHKGACLQSDLSARQAPLGCRPGRHDLIGA